MMDERIRCAHCGEVVESQTREHGTDVSTSPRRVERLINIINHPCGCARVDVPSSWL